MSHTLNGAAKSQTFVHEDPAVSLAVTTGHVRRSPYVSKKAATLSAQGHHMVTVVTSDQVCNMTNESANGDNSGEYRLAGSPRVLKQSEQIAKSDGEESQSLLCSETFTSPTPPGDVEPWSQLGDNNIGNGEASVEHTQHAYDRNRSSYFTHKSALSNNVPSKIIAWLQGSATVFVDAKSASNTHPKDYLLKAALLGVAGNSSKKEDSEKDINSNIQAKCAANNSTHFVGNDGDTCQRMSGTNGYDRNRMTGSSSGSNNDSLGRLTDGSVSQGPSQPLVTPVEGMLMQGRIGRPAAIGLHEGSSRSIITGTVGAGPQVTLGNVFRPPQSVSETGRYPAAFTTAAGGSGPFSPLMTSHGGGSLYPYGFYSGQYSGYNPSVIHGPLDPQFGSYSAVLQSMGSHAVSQVPRSPYTNSPGSATTLTQLQLLNMQQTSSASGKVYATNSERDDSKFRREQQDFDIQRRHSTTGVIKEEPPHHYSVQADFTEPARLSVSSALSRESPSQKRELSSGGSDIYKVPSGREGSLKHRILRPSDATSSVSIGNPQQSAFINTDEPSLKRTKTNKLECEREPQPPVGVTFSSESSRGVTGYPPPPNSHLQYPQHFMKGSIIQLANGDYKRVEDLETSDFVQSAEISSDLKIDSSTVVHIEENRAQGTAVLSFVVGEHKVKVTVEATVEHPFFVFGQGWSSCEPAWTSKRYGLDCHRLTVGDVCISLTHKEVAARAAEISQQQQQQNKLEGCSVFKKDVKAETSSHMSPGRNKSPGHVTSGSFSPPQHSVRSDSRPTHDPSVKDEHLFTPPTSQITLSSPQAQEQKSRPSPTTTAS